MAEGVEGIGKLHTHLAGAADSEGSASLASSPVRSPILGEQLLQVLEETKDNSPLATVCGAMPSPSVRTEPCRVAMAGGQARGDG